MEHALTAALSPREGGGILLGLTGSSGSGQSTVSKILAKSGFEIFSLDEAGHRLLEKGHVKRAVAALTGDPSLAFLDGSSIRKILRRKAFDSPDTMAAIESALHPRMSRWMSLCSHIIMQCNGKAVFEGALFFELGGAAVVGSVIVMASEERDCIARIMARDGLDEHRAARRLAMQMPLTERLEKADWVILNSAGTSEASLGIQALAIVDCLSRAEKNTRRNDGSQD